MSTHPKRVDKFRAWAKLMMEQALVPDRVSYSNASPGHGAVAPRMAPRAGKKRHRRRRKWRQWRRKRNHGRT